MEVALLFNLITKNKFTKFLNTAQDCMLYGSCLLTAFVHLSFVKIYGGGGNAARGPIERDIAKFFYIPQKLRDFWTKGF